MILLKETKQTRVDYWDLLYKQIGKIYGEHPSSFAHYISSLVVKQNGSMKLLEMAHGYGRNSILFAQKGIEVVGIDLSFYGLKIAERDKTKYSLQNLQFLQQDIFEINYYEEFDVVFSNFVFHLFYEVERELLYQKSFSLLKKGGVFANSFLSIEDSDYGIGTEIESNTFVKDEELEKPQHFYSLEEIEDIHERNGFIIQNINPDKELELLVYKDIQREICFWNVIAKKQ
ncbi:MAG: hypothetical protein C0412_20015 [Flavobacterium sp.]|nr:hypothetical protein [Flavobacterium sp.]